jgi:phospholipid/cholesterol/gamma-HCH transport system permease protein
VIKAARLLSRIGSATRRQVAHPIHIAALLWGVLWEGAQPGNWRRTVRASFRETLTEIVAGSLGAIAVAAAIVGIGIVFQALFWLRTAGEEESAAGILVAVLFREIAPLLIGIILLGRSGIALVAELGALRADGEIAMLRAEGIDPFHYLVLPRAVAFAVGGFTLGFVFLLLALFAGYATASVLGIAHRSPLGFLAEVLRAMSARDFAMVPAKFVLIGLLVALGGCATTLVDVEHEPLALILPRAFMRGVTAVLIVSVILSALL